MSSKGYMLDTNVFNHVLNGEIELERLLQPPGSIYVTHIQRDELSFTKDKTKNAKLMTLLSRAKPINLPTESAVWDVSRWDEAKWGTAGYHIQIKQFLDSKNTKKLNDRDALIAETAIVNGLTLITNDQDLKEITLKLGGKVQDWRMEK